MIENKIKYKFKAIYNPYTRELAVKFGSHITYNKFDEEEEWCIVNWNGDENNPNYLHIQIDYDENFQLLFYPRIDGKNSLNEHLGTYYNSENKKKDQPKNVKIVHTDREWDLQLEKFLKPSVKDTKSFKKINY